MLAGAFERAGRLLEQWRRTLILTHDRPDGDAIGCIGAMKRIIERAGRAADACLFQAPPDRYRFIAEACGVSRWPLEPGGPVGPFDGVLILDTCSWKQLEPAGDFLRSTPLPKIVVDHHQTRDDLKAASSAWELVSDPSAASACGLIDEWRRRQGWSLDAAAREALFAGMATDTGWFRFPSVDGRTLRAAAGLIEAGVKPDVMYARLFEGHRPARLRLLREALDTLELHEDQTVAVMRLTQAMFLRAGAEPPDAEDLVNEPLAIGSVIVSVLLSDAEGSGVVRVNFRSRSPEVCGRDIDVSALAARFGGGGHARAAGARVQATLEAVREQVLAAVAAVLRA
ncbi:MAG: exopolyphosphatase [Phycisphaerae bacterium]